MRRRSFASEGSLAEDEPEGLSRGHLRALFCFSRVASFAKATAVEEHVARIEVGEGVERG